MTNLKFHLIREQIIILTRNFFQDRNFHEAVTPILTPSIPLESNIYPFSTVWKTAQGEKKLYLATSPEAGLKKMLAAGIGDCFSIGHAFRNLENSGSLHTPEFLMLEWYRVGADYHKIMSDVSDYVLFLSKNLSSPTTNYQLLATNHWPLLSLPDLFQQYAHTDIKQVSDNDFFQLFVNKIEPRIPQDPCFITDYPARLSPLCRPKKNNPYLAERFEFYWKGIELANGNTENTDVKSIQKHFESELKIRKGQKIEAPPIANEFLDSLKSMAAGGKNYAGVGLGLDRLAMIFSGTASLAG